MAAVSKSRRSLAGIILAIGGALLLIDFILGLAQVTTLGVWLTVLAEVAIGVAFLVLAIASFRNTLARIALIVSAVGFLLLALGAVVTLPGVLGTIASIAAAGGMLVAAIVLYAGKEITNLTAIVFIVTAAIATIVVVLGLLNPPADPNAPAAPSTLDTILALLYAIGILVTGVLLARVQGSRGR